MKTLRARIGTRRLKREAELTPGWVSVRSWAGEPALHHVSEAISNPKPHAFPGFAVVLPQGAVGTARLQAFPTCSGSPTSLRQHRQESLHPLRELPRCPWGHSVPGSALPRLESYSQFMRNAVGWSSEGC